MACGVQKERLWVLRGAGAAGGGWGAPAQVCVPVPPLPAWQSRWRSDGMQSAHPSGVYAYAFQKCASFFRGCHHHFTVEHGRREIIKIPACGRGLGLRGALWAPAPRQSILCTARCPKSRIKEKNESEAVRAQA